MSLQILCWDKTNFGDFLLRYRYNDKNLSHHAAAVFKSSNTIHWSTKDITFSYC